MKRMVSVIMVAGMVSAASAVSLINTDFTSPYIDGDLAGQTNWLAMPETGIQAFSVDATAGVADTAPFAGSFNTTNGNYVYLSPSNAVGNVVDDEWTGSMDFSLSTTNADGWVIGTQEIFDIGLTPDATNKLSSADAGDVHMHLRWHNSGAVWATLSKAARFRTLGALTDAQLGWDPTNTTNTPNLSTDKLNLTWTIRKTRTDNTYSAVAVLSNTVTGASSVFDPDFHAPTPNLNYVVNTNAYPASNLTFAMGHHSSADGDGTAPMIDIAIDSLVVDQTSGVAPVLEVPTLSATSGNTLVELSWTLSPDATSYDVQRALVSGGPYSSIGTTNGLGYADTGVVNNTVYYYIVTASSAGVADADSNEVVGEPQSAQTGSIIDTHFKAVEGYVNADLDGQSRWKWATDTGEEGFMVTDAAGSGFADTTPFTNSFDTLLGNDVYYNTLMSNNVDDEWNGTVNFTLSIEPYAGLTVTNINDFYDETGTNLIETVTNWYDIAGVGYYDIFHMGLTDQNTKDTGLAVNQNDDVDVIVRFKASFGDLAVELSDTGISVEMKHEDAGWDPDWDDSSNTNGPDFETDELTVAWQMRKTYDGYAMKADLIAGTTTNLGIWQTTAKSPDAYAADLVMFGLNHNHEADRGGEVDQNNGVQVTIDSLSLAVSNSAPPPMVAPTGLRGQGAEASAILNWDISLFTETFSVYRYDSNVGGSFVILTNGLDALTYTDTGLVNGTTYFYTVAAEYGVHGEVETDRLPVRPLGKATVVSWGYGILAGGGRVQFSYSDVTVSNIINSIGAATGGAVYEAEDVDSNLAPLLYSITQLDDSLGSAYWAQRQINSPSPFNTLKLNCREDAGADIHSSLSYIEQAEFSGGNALDLTAETHSMEAQVDNTGGVIGGVHFAIRNGTQWYVSESLFPDGGTVSVPDMTVEKWTSLTEATMASTNMMTVIGETYAVVAGLNNVTAFGVFADHVDQIDVEGFKVIAGETATSLQLWTDGFEIYNDDADGTNDYDLDGVNNVHEWGTMGDPTDDADNGRPTSLLGLDGTGTNLVYIYPRLESTDRPTYTVLDNENLVYTDFVEATDVVESGAGLWDTNNPGLGLEAVTNLVPVDVNAKFIGLEITE